ncbi:hypothetical protein VULLAG_LOCUS10255 [Vulpes lagopus]
MEAPGGVRVGRWGCSPQQVSQPGVEAVLGLEWTEGLWVLTGPDSEKRSVNRFLGKCSSSGPWSCLPATGALADLQAGVRVAGAATAPCSSGPSPGEAGADTLVQATMCRASVAPLLLSTKALTRSLRHVRSGPQGGHQGRGRASRGRTACPFPTWLLVATGSHGDGQRPSRLSQV